MDSSETSFGTLQGMQATLSSPYPFIIQASEVAELSPALHFSVRVHKIHFLLLNLKFASPCIIQINQPPRCNNFSSLLLESLCTAHVSGVLTTIIRSSTTAVAFFICSVCPLPRAGTREAANVFRSRAPKLIKNYYFFIFAPCILDMKISLLTL